MFNRFDNILGEINALARELFSTELLHPERSLQEASDIVQPLKQIISRFYELPNALIQEHSPFYEASQRAGYIYSYVIRDKIDLDVLITKNQVEKFQESEQIEDETERFARGDAISFYEHLFLGRSLHEPYEIPAETRSKLINYILGRNHIEPISEPIPEGELESYLKHAFSYLDLLHNLRERSPVNELFDMPNAIRYFSSVRLGRDVFNDVVHYLDFEFLRRSAPDLYERIFGTSENPYEGIVQIMRLGCIPKPFHHRLLSIDDLRTPENLNSEESLAYALKLSESVDEAHKGKFTVYIPLNTRDPTWAVYFYPENSLRGTEPWFQNDLNRLYEKK